MTELYLVRHCEAQGNVDRVIQGILDTEVTEMGRRQLEHLGRRFDGIDIDVVLASPLKRTRATAHAIADRKGLDVVIDDGFVEMNCGIYEGVPFDELFPDPQFVDVWNNHPQDFAPEGGETQPSVYVRIWEAVQNAARTNKDKKIVAATHGGVLRALLCRLLFDDLNCLSKVPYGFNTAITLLRFDDNMNVELVFYNDHSHLPEECVPKGSAVPEPSEE